MSCKPDGISYPGPPEGDVSIVIERSCDAPVILSRDEECRRHIDECLLLWRFAIQQMVPLIQTA